MELRKCQRCGASILRSSGLLGLIDNNLCRSCDDALQDQAAAASAVLRQASADAAESSDRARKTAREALLIPLSKEQKRKLLLDPGEDELKALFAEVDFRGKDEVTLDFRDVFADDSIKAGINPNYFVNNPRGDAEEHGVGWSLDMSSSTIVLERPLEEKEIEAEESRERAGEAKKLASALVLALILGGAVGSVAFFALRSPLAGFGSGAIVTVIAFWILGE